MNKEKPLLLFVLLWFVFFGQAATVDTVSIYSPSMHKEIKCVVVRPDNYDKNSSRYPVVYLLHGYSGNYAYWVRSAPAILREADAYQILLVCPDGAYSSWYFDSPIDSSSRYETHISREVVEYIDTHFRTLADRHHRAITGLSMGGHGAFYIGLRHPDLFGAMGSTSGGVDFRPFKTHWDIAKQIGDSVNYKDNWENMTVINMVGHYPTDSLAIIFDCGTEDFFLQVNRELHSKMLSLNIPHDYIERPGKHNSEYWRNSIGYQLFFFKKYFTREDRISLFGSGK